MALKRLVPVAFWTFFTVLCVSHSPNTQTAISRLLFIRLTSSLHHSSSVGCLRLFWCVVNGFGTARSGWILDLLHCLVRQSHPKYPNCHISASICPFDPISSPFVIYRIRSIIFIRSKRLWDGSFWLNFGPSALDRASMVPQIPKLSYLGFYLSVFPHLFTIPHLYNPCKYFYVLEWAVLAAYGTFCTVSCVNAVPQIYKLPHLGLYLSVWPHLFTIPHL